MTGPSWLVDSKRIAKKIKSASGRADPRNIKWIGNPSRACPKCNHVIDNSEVVQDWPGLPHGVKFDPSDQELLWHLIAKAGEVGVDPHPFINEFIPTVEEEDGICYTHPQKLPGVKQDGSISHFFHRTFKAYNTGTRKRRKINTDDFGDVRWHKTGKTKPVVLNGEHLGCKKIMVLYVSAAKGGKSEKTNWVMHQYHLGSGENEKDGEFVVSKIFYQQQFKPCESGRANPIIKSNVVTEMETIACTGSATPEFHEEHQYLVQTSDEISDQLKVNHDTTDENNEVYLEVEKHHDQYFTANDELEKHDNEATAQDSQSAPDPKWWEGESQFLLDSQQLAEGIAVCEEFLQSQSSYAEDDEKPCNKSCLSDYASMGAEDFKRDLEECQKLARGDDHSINEVDPAPEMRLSQLEFGSQDSFMGWAASKLADY